MNADEPTYMDDDNPSKRQERIVEEALYWASQEMEGREIDAAAFSRWLNRSPEHVKEYLLACGWNETLPQDLARSTIDVDKLLSGANVIDVTDRIAPPERRFESFDSPRLRKIMAGAVAIVAFLAIVPFAIHLWPVSTYVTSTGEQRTIALADGSVVALNTQSRVRVSFSAQTRDIFLTAGQALFTVAHDPHRPFRVHVSGGAMVQAIGTKFDVRRMDDSTAVAVIEGRVQVTPSSGGAQSHSLDALAQRTRLAAGQAIQIADIGTMTPPRPVDIVEINAWQQRRLIFRDQSLRTIVDEFNRYTQHPIRIEDAELAERRYSGVWDADHPEVLLKYLVSNGDVFVNRKVDQIVLSTESPATERPALQ